MKYDAMTQEQLASFERSLRDGERSDATREKYLRETRAFACWLGDRELTKENTTAWKRRLVETGRAPAGINAALSALKGLLAFLNRSDCRVRVLKVQRRVFCEPERELSRAEYERLVRTAVKLGRERLALTLETICSTGIRVSELRFITVEAAAA